MTGTLAWITLAVQGLWLLAMPVAMGANCHGDACTGPNPLSWPWLAAELILLPVSLLAATYLVAQFLAHKLDSLDRR